MHPQKLSNFALVTNKLSSLSYCSNSLYSESNGTPLLEQMSQFNPINVKGDV